MSIEDPFKPNQNPQNPDERADSDAPENFVPPQREEFHESQLGTPDSEGIRKLIEKITKEE